jgi:prepilin-type N-terminal cleavage/methylation domain-containing protein
MRKNKGFTLLELIVVLIVLAILALIAIPSYNAVMDKAAAQAALVSAQSMARDANALAAFDDAATTDTQLSTAAGETSGAVFSGNTAAVDDGCILQTVTKGGRSGSAHVVDATGLAVATGGVCP